MNNFTFNSKHYLQKHGTAMGTKMAPSYANLFLGKFEHDVILNSPYQPHIWFRFIDDIFMIWTDYVNNLHSTIKFTFTHSPPNIPFLDVMVSIKDLYTKPTDKHQYLLIYLFHLVILNTLNVLFLTTLHFAFAAFAPTTTITQRVLMSL